MLILLMTYLLKVIKTKYFPAAAGLIIVAPFIGGA